MRGALSPHQANCIPAGGCWLCLAHPTPACRHLSGVHALEFVCFTFHASGCAPQRTGSLECRPTRARALQEVKCQVRGVQPPCSGGSWLEGGTQRQATRAGDPRFVGERSVEGQRHCTWCQAFDLSSQHHVHGSAPRYYILVVGSGARGCRKRQLCPSKPSAPSGRHSLHARRRLESQPEYPIPLVCPWGGSWRTETEVTPAWQGWRRCTRY